MIPIVMGASKEAYNLFGPEVNIVLLVDDGWMAYLIFVTHATHGVSVKMLK